MSDKIRGALFNALGDLGGLQVLDAFAGSGALSFEAVSHGATSVVAIDNDRSAQQAIEESIKELGVGRSVKLIKAGAGAWLKTTDELFDIVLADPPYDDVQPKLLVQLADRVKIGGLIVLSLPPTTSLDLSDNFEMVAAKQYGDAQLVFYRHIR